jgi:hypothetical protein
VTAPPKTWKAVERKFARAIGSERTPLSGGNSRHTRSDSLHPGLFAEIKYGSAVPTTWREIERLFFNTEELARLEHKTPVVALHAKGARDFDCYVRNPFGGGAIVCVSLLTFGVWLSEGKLTPPDEVDHPD